MKKLWMEVRSRGKKTHISMKIGKEQSKKHFREQFKGIDWGKVRKKRWMNERKKERGTERIEVEVKKEEIKKTIRKLKKWKPAGQEDITSRDVPIQINIIILILT